MKEEKLTLGQMADKQTKYSRTHWGLCKNKGCENYKRKGSSFCQECSDKYKNNN